MELATLAAAVAKGATPAIFKLATALRTKLERKHLTSLQRLAQDSVIAVFAASEADADNQIDRDVEIFLQSAPFSDVCYQSILIHAAQIPHYGEQELTRNLQYHLRYSLGQDASIRWAQPLARLVSQLSSNIVTSDFFRRLLASSRLEPEAHRRLIEQYVSGIESRLDAIEGARASITVAQVDGFEKKYRSQMQARYRNLTPANFGSPKPVPFSKVYVPPALLLGGERIKLGEFTASIYRSVVVGNPGGGKTTLTKKVVLDACSKGGLYGRKDHLVPFVVTLREYAARKLTEPISIVDFIQDFIRSRLQISDLPAGVVPYLLSIGRGLVIFDGLDELLDTSYRQQIVEDVEMFCSLYVSAPVLVTSREVGYTEAPLDPTTFEIFTLGEFDEEQIQDYVSKWFSNAPDVPSDERTKLPTAFVSESSSVRDLTSNPLMLSLMCSLYRGERYIPKNRPDLYEKCATLLFERWDKGRKILVKLPTEAHVRPALMSIALKIFESPKLQEGVRRSELEQMATAYLLQAKYDHEDKARKVADKFIDFCTGRAWVFTNTGNDGHEELYQFTHRTFLEYFAASHLVRTNATPEALLDELAPRIIQAEWDVVAQLSVNIISRNVEGAADLLASTLLDLLPTIESNERVNVVGFLARSLSFMVPRESTVRDVTRSLLLETTRAQATGPVRNLARSSSAIGVASELLHVAEENQDAVVEALKEGLNELVSEGETVAIDFVCSELAPRIDEDSDRGRSAIASPDPQWSSRLNEVLSDFARSLPSRIDSNACSVSRYAAIELTRRGLLSTAQLISVAGISDSLEPAWNSAAGSIHAPETYLMVGHFGGRNRVVWRTWSKEALAVLEASPPPWFRAPTVPGPIPTVLDSIVDGWRSGTDEPNLAHRTMEVVIACAMVEVLLVEFSRRDRRRPGRSVDSGSGVIVGGFSSASTIYLSPLARSRLGLSRGRSSYLQRIRATLLELERDSRSRHATVLAAARRSAEWSEILRKDLDGSDSLA